MAKDLLTLDFRDVQPVRTSKGERSQRTCAAVIVFLIASYQNIFINWFCKGRAERDKWPGEVAMVSGANSTRYINLHGG